MTPLATFVARGHRFEEPMISMENMCVHNVCILAFWPVHNVHMLHMRYAR
jgi:hypothetical protein